MGNIVTSFDKEFNLAISRNIKLKSKILFICFGVILFFQLLSMMYYPHIREGWAVDFTSEKLRYLPMLIAAIMLAEAFSYFSVSKAIREGKLLSKGLGMILSVLEASFPSVTLFIMCKSMGENGPMSYEGLFGGPSIFLYFLFILLSSLYLDFRFSVIIGAVASVEYAVLIIYFLTDKIHGADIILTFSRSIFLFASGIVAGFVSGKIKESVQMALQAKNELITTLDFKVKEKTREIEKQNELLAEKNKNITDSINYAQRIQRAILPPDKTVSQHLPDSFVLYLPKDVVSGDFYFVEKLGNKVVFAAVDCTGHGVPGALMSVVGFNYLSQAVGEKKISKPSDILNFLDMGVNQTLRQSVGSGVNDGMDLSLCSLDIQSRELQYAGAYNPLWLIKKSSPDICEEFRADKFPIGVNISGKADEYTNHSVKLEKGDTIYLFSDGYADQFGGPKGKKFKYKPLQDLLISVQGKSMNEQKKTLYETFLQWRGALEQVDDICVLGVRV